MFSQDKTRLLAFVQTLVILLHCCFIRSHADKFGQEVVYEAGIILFFKPFLRSFLCAPVSHTSVRSAIHLTRLCSAPYIITSQKFCAGSF